MAVCANERDLDDDVSPPADDDRAAPEYPELPQMPEPPTPVVSLPDHPVKNDGKKAGEYREMGLAYTLPTALIAPVIVLTCLGAWIDGRSGSTSSPFTIGGAVLGTIAGMVNMLRMAARLGK